MLYYTFQDPKQTYLCLELCEEGNLEQILRQNLFLSIEAITFYTAEICCGIKHLRANSIVHRDLKPDNVLIDRKGHIKLCDFGCAVQLTGSRCGYRCYGAPLYTVKLPLLRLLLLIALLIYHWVI